MMHLKKIIDDFYSKELERFPESGVLEALYQIDIWDNLNDYEKVDKRKNKLVYYEKHSLLSPKELAYEVSIIKVTEIILFFLKNTENDFCEIENINGLDAYIFRIRNLLFCEKTLINRNMSFKHINHVLLELIDPLIEQIKNTNEYKKYNLDVFILEYKKMIDLNLLMK